MKTHNVAVIGVGQTAFRSRYDEKTYPELAQDAVALALADCKLGPDEIDAVVFSMAPTTFMGVADADKWAVDHVWARGKPFMRVHTGGATGGSALQAAHAHVASGQYGTVLVVGADRITETPDAQFVLNLIWDPLLRAGLRPQHGDDDGAGDPALHAQVRHHRGAVRQRRRARPPQRPGQSLGAPEGSHRHRRGDGFAAHLLALQAVRHLPALGRRRRGRHHQRDAGPGALCPAGVYHRHGGRVQHGLHGRPHGALGGHRLRRLLRA